MDHGLTNIQNIDATVGQHTRNGSRETRAVFTGDVYQDNFAQGAPPQWKKTAFYSLSVTTGHSERFAATGSLAILRPNFFQESRAQ
jgi:hypothetical protein